MKSKAPVSTAATGAQTLTVGTRLGQQVRSGLVRDLKKQLTGVDTVVMARLDRVPTRKLNELRQSLETQNATFLVVKNSLCRLVFRDLGFTGLETAVEGTCGVSSIRGDVASVSKLLTQFAKEHEGFFLRGGILKGQLLQKRDLEELAKIPSREVLLSQLAGVIQSPIRNMAFLLTGPIRSFVLVLKGMAQKKER